MNTKKWSLIIMIGFFAILLGIGITVIIVDPYFHFHAPIEGLSYEIEEYEYINDGIIRNFEYDALIIGTSLTECTSIKEINQLYDVNSVRLTFLGEGFKQIGENLDKALKVKPNMKLVIWGLDTMMFTTDKDYYKYDTYPTYLYDNNLWNDVKYLYNIDILTKDVFPEIVRTLEGEQADSFDEEGWKWEVSSRKKVLETYNRPAKEMITVTENSMKEYIERLDENLEQNVLSVIQSNPDVTFYIFFPPYSICWWDSLNQNGEAVLKRRITLEQYAIEKLLDCGNVKLFSFFNNFELTTDLNHYRDDCHYTADINSQILVWMKNDEYRLTENNYMKYIEEITAFYTTYDYESIFIEKE